MGSSMVGSILIMSGLIFLMVSCSAVNQLEHDSPIKPIGKQVDKAMAKRLKNTNRIWYVESKNVIANN